MSSVFQPQDPGYSYVLTSIAGMYEPSFPVEQSELESISTLPMSLSSIATPDATILDFGVSYHLFNDMKWFANLGPVEVVKEVV